MFNILYESSDDDEQPNAVDTKRYRPLITHDNTKDFYERFRLYPDQFGRLMNLIGGRLEPIQRTNYAIEGKFKLMATLRFLGHNSDFSSLLDETGPSKASVSRFIKQPTIVLLDVLKNTIKWPDSPISCREIALEFSRMTRFGIPNCVGALDGTIVPIVGPKSKTFNQNSYWTRHHCYGINVLGVCDAKGRFLFVSSRFPGKANDARVYNETLEPKFRPPFPGAYLLADSAYGASEKLIPMRALPENPPPSLKRFYESHAKTRVIIECCFGRWKNKFLCLKRELRFTDPRICSSIIMCCAYLHNFILASNEAEQIEMNQEIGRYMLNRYGLEEEEEYGLEDEEQPPEGPLNPRERRQRGAELLNNTLNLFKQMHVIQ